MEELNVIYRSVILGCRVHGQLENWHLAGISRKQETWALVSLLRAMAGKEPVSFCFATNPPLTLTKHCFNCSSTPTPTPYLFHILTNWGWAWVRHSQHLVLRRSNLVLHTPWTEDVPLPGLLHISFQHEGFVTPGSCVGFWSQLGSGNERWC